MKAECSVNGLGTPQKQLPLQFPQWKTGVKRSKPQRSGFKLSLSLFFEWNELGMDQMFMMSKALFLFSSSQNRIWAAELQHSDWTNWCCSNGQNSAAFVTWREQTSNSFKYTVRSFCCYGSQWKLNEQPAYSLSFRSFLATDHQIKYTFPWIKVIFNVTMMLFPFFFYLQWGNWFSLWAPSQALCSGGLLDADIEL